MVLMEKGLSFKVSVYSCISLFSSSSNQGILIRQSASLKLPEEVPAWIKRVSFSYTVIL